MICFRHWLRRGVGFLSTGGGVWRETFFNSGGSAAGAIFLQCSKLTEGIFVLKCHKSRQKHFQNFPPHLPADIFIFKQKAPPDIFRTDGAFCLLLFFNDYILLASAVLSGHLPRVIFWHSIAALYLLPCVSELYRTLINSSLIYAKLVCNVT